MINNVTPIRQPELPDSLPGFEHINRFWDKQHRCHVAKILPGEFYVSKANEKIATTLGSCVSACIWDCQMGVGGMNHFMLPLTEKELHEVTWGNAKSDATRYGNYAMEHLVNEILKNGGLRKNLRAKVFGGGKVLKQENNIGQKNADFVLDYIDVENIRLLSQDLGSNYPRKVLFDPLTGKVLMKRLKAIHNDTIVVREKDYQKSIITKPIEGDIELF